MLNTRSRYSLDDLPLEILSRIFVVLGTESAKDIIFARLRSKKMYEAGGDRQVFRTTCIDMFEAMGPKILKVDLFICTCALHNNIEVMFRQGIVFSDDGEYTSVVDSAKELLWTVDVVHRLTTNNITFQCEHPHHSVKGAFAIGHEEDEDRQRYCMVCRWYVEYGRFCIFLKNING
uniref:F-box domain-containing protein n=1 Tax=Lactuca sativa TaxID=4236 RepID=A0A9R1XI85_LACSA|nr:hypothetical protein LSAT_V11C400159320 [Lactuca sativa]